MAGSSPPGIAWITRNAIRLFRLQAMPHSAEPSANAASANMYTRLSPKRLPSHALAGTTTPSTSEYAVEIHWTSAVLPPSSVWIVATATLTMLVSRMDMNMPAISTASGTTQCAISVGPAAAAGAGRGGATAGPVPFGLVLGAGAATVVATTVSAVSVLTRGGS